MSSIALGEMATYTVLVILSSFFLLAVLECNCEGKKLAVDKET